MNTLTQAMDYRVSPRKPACGSSTSCVNPSHFSFSNLTILKRLKPSCTLAQVMAYNNDAVVARFLKEFDITQHEADVLFDDLKRFLWLSTVTNGPIAPSPVIDDAWHVFIFFTADYADFCSGLFGRFLHHRPDRPNDLPDGGAAVRRTIAAIEGHFGGFKNLSANWAFPGMDCWGGSCSSDSVSCAPTPSCSN